MANILVLFTLKQYCLSYRAMCLPGKLAIIGIKTIGDLSKQYTTPIKNPATRPGFEYQQRINASSTVDAYVLYADPLSYAQLYARHE
ncbi:hypothetical protein GCM10010919_31490 [Alishewanella longhuensis]|uniref:Uncharacterized protein n=1 Tax=Alishewanella longhuensis TaxID=1091037 RepID=A0ABQ3L226_9ALTE|nr:hypothetical protein GCM10010919_31490 [Alishewanella longhuensis]